MLVIYKINQAGRVNVSQKIIGSNTALESPQHAIYSRDGNKIIVSNWSSETFTIYPSLPGGLYSSIPVSVVNFPKQLCGYKPHGLAINSVGSLMAVAFGAAANKPKAIATFGFDALYNSVHLHGILEGDFLPGIPKGICFSPDDSHLMVTFSDVNCIKLYELDSKTGAIRKAASRAHQGFDTGLDRPEDISLSHLKDYVIVSNSGNNTITIYKFNKVINQFIERAPKYTLGQQQPGFAFPHGLAVSPDGRYLAATQFGPLLTTLDENIIFSRETPTRQSKIWIFECALNKEPPISQQNWPWTRWVRELRDRLEERS